MDTAADPAGGAQNPALAVPPARADLVAILERVGENYPIETAIEDASQRGFVLKFTWLDPPTAYVRVWEHPAAAAHNAELDRSTAAILDSFLFALYELRADRDRAGVPPYVLVVGRVGNTGNYEIWTGV